MDALSGDGAFTATGSRLDILTRHVISSITHGGNADRPIIYHPVYDVKLMAAFVIHQSG